MLKKVSGVIEVESEIDSIDNVFLENEEISIYRIVQESVNNTIKHSNASGASVIIKREKSEVLIKVGDNGRGFDAENVVEKCFGLGLVSLKERSNLLGAEINIDSSPGKGTRIAVRIPVRSRR